MFVKLSTVSTICCFGVCGDGFAPSSIMYKTKNNPIRFTSFAVVALANMHKSHVPLCKNCC
jgi:hypothetical protein